MANDNTKGILFIMTAEWPFFSIQDSLIKFVYFDEKYGASYLSHIFGMRTLIHLSTDIFISNAFLIYNGKKK